MRLSGTVLVILTFLLFQIPSFAQTPQRLTLQSAVQRAIDFNPELQKKRQNIRLAEAEYLRAIGVFLPNLNLGLGWDYSSNLRRVGFRDTIRNRTVYNSFELSERRYSWSLNSSLNLFNGLNDWKGLEQSEFNLEAIKTKFDRDAQTTILDVTSSYLIVLQRQELLKIAQENLSYQDEQLKKITEMTKLGLRPQIDLYNQQVQKSNAELDVINAEKNLSISKSQLVSILALDPTSEYEIETPEPGKESSDKFELAALIAAAFQQRPDLTAQQYTIKSKEHGVWQAWTGYAPSLDLTWSWGSSANSPTGNDYSVINHLTRLRGYSVGLSLSIPIFDRFQTNYAIERAGAELRDAQYDLESLERSIQVSVKQAYLDFVSYKKSYEVTQDQFKAASLLKETAQERYNLGAGSYLELANAVKDFTTAASNLTQAKFQYEFQKKVLEFHIGTLKLEDYITIR